MTGRVRAIRGATTVDEDTPEQVVERTVVLLREIIDRNGLAEDDLVSLLFTATDDIRSEFPAAAARKLGLGAVPRMCARELDVAGAAPRCIRVMVHCYSDRERLRHVYLEGAEHLRHDLPG